MQALNIETSAPSLAAAKSKAGNPGYQAYQILHFGFTVAPIVAGLDKFIGLLVAPRLAKEDDKIIIQSASCPFMTAVKAHPEVCRVAQTLVAQITGGRVRESCIKLAAFSSR